MTSPLFKDSQEDFSMDYCANCGGYLSGVRIRAMIRDRAFLVCSFACESQLKAQHSSAQAEEQAEEKEK